MSWLLRLLFGPPVPRVSGDEARALLDQGAILLDVRTAGEFARDALPGALNIPVSSLGRRLEDLPRDRAVVVYCLSGSRSRRAARKLLDAGFAEVHDLGRISSW